MSLPLFIGLTVAICYFSGSIPFGLIIGKINKIDIRQHGSGNIGATNVLRILGKKWGYTCFACDLLKGLLPVIACKVLAKKFGHENVEYLSAIAVVTTVLGHVYSIFINFKGGKGIATSAGAILAIAPYSLLVALFLWLLIFKMSGYVSLASIIAAVAIPFLGLLENYLRLHDNSISIYSITILFALAILVVVKHRSNIQRLREGTESSFKKKVDVKP